MMRIEKPETSVVMSVYNAAKTLREAVDSILQQTYTNFEFIIVDDGSMDESTEILDSYHDDRIVRYRFETNGGLTRAVNYGISNARGEFIARMDADDVSAPQRLEQEIGLIQSNPAIGLVSCWYRLIFEERPTQLMQPPQGDEELQQMLFYRNPICHPAVVFRRELWERLGGYVVDRYYPAEDWELWLRMAEITHLEIVPMPLLDYRIWSESVSVYRRRQQLSGIRLLLEEARQRREQGAGEQMKDLTMSRHHLLVGLLHLMEGDERLFKEELSRAIQATGSLGNDGEHVRKEVVFFALEAGRLEGGGEASEAKFLQRFIEYLPSSEQGLKRDIWGEYFVATAFRHYRNHEWSSTRRRIWEGAKNKPDILLKRGVISIGARSTIQEIRNSTSKILHNSIHQKR